MKCEKEGVVGCDKEGHTECDKEGAEESQRRCGTYVASPPSAFPSWPQPPRMPVLHPLRKCPRPSPCCRPPSPWRRPRWTLQRVFSFLA